MAENMRILDDGTVFFANNDHYVDGDDGGVYIPIHHIDFWTGYSNGVTLIMMSGKDITLGGLSRRDFEQVIKEVEKAEIKRTNTLAEELEIPGIATLKLSDDERERLDKASGIHQERVKDLDDKKYAKKIFDYVGWMISLIQKKCK